MSGMQMAAVTWTCHVFDAGCSKLGVTPGGGEAKGMLAGGGKGKNPGVALLAAATGAIASDVESAGGGSETRMSQLHGIVDVG